MLYLGKLQNYKRKLEKTFKLNEIDGCFDYVCDKYINDGIQKDFNGDHINLVYIETIFGENEDLNGLRSKSDILKFTISYGGDMRTLVYQTDVKRFSEINNIKNEILNFTTK